MKAIFKRINKLIYRKRFEKIYYLKARPGTWQKTRSSLTLSSLSMLKPSPVPVIFGLTIAIGMAVLLIRNHPLPPKVKAHDLTLYPASRGSNYLYQNTTNGFKVYLGSRLEEKKPRIKFEQDSSFAEISLAQFPNQGAKLEKDSNSSIIYKEVYQGVDIKYYLTEKGIKEEIILKDKIKNNNFVFNLNLKNAVPKKSLDQQSSGFFIDPNTQEYVFHIPQPFMIDSVGNRTEAVELKIDQQSIISNEGSQTLYTITLIPNQEWLQSAVYPVVIDPSVVHDESSEFSGTTNRIEDAGSDTAPKLRVPYHELPADEHTVALWHFNETSENSCTGGEDACDSSGNDLDGTATGTTITTSGQKLGAAARDFNGSSDYVSVANNSLLNPSDGIITLCAWFNADTLPSSGDVQIVSKWATGGYVVYFDGDDGHLYFAVRNSGDSRKDAGVLFTETNSWHHVCGVNDGTILKIYLDGKETTGEVISGHTTNSESLYIGAYDGSTNYFDGTIDEIWLSDIARTPEEIKQSAQRFPYGVYTSQSIDLTSGTGTVASIDSIEWTDNVSTPGATLDGYPNFKPVIIDNTQNSNELTDYQVKVDVDYDSNMQSDFDDLRFTSHTATVSAYGNEETFNSANTHMPSLAALDSTHFVVGYSDTGGSAYGCAKVGTVSGSTISYGSEYCFNEAQTGYPVLTALNSASFVAAYTDEGGSYYGCAKVGTVSGSTISYGSEYCFHEAVTYYNSITTLDSNHFVIAYKGHNFPDEHCGSRLGTVLGTSISYGSETDFYDAGVGDDYISLATLGPTRFVVFYTDSSVDGQTKVGVVSGTSISYGSATTLDSYNGVRHKTAIGLTSNSFLIAYDLNLPGYYDGVSLVGKVSGTSISYGEESYFNYTTRNTYLDVTLLSSTKFVLSYRDHGGDTYGHAKVGTVINTNLDYWIEEKSDGVEAKVWVEADAIPASSMATIWMWYGNGGASAGSSGDNTFYFFDDFETDLSKWTQNADGGTIEQSTTQVYDGTYSCRIYHASGGTWDTYIEKSSLSLQDVIVESRVYHPSTTGQGIFEIHNSGRANIAMVGDDASAHSNWWYRYDGSGYESSVARTVDWHKMWYVVKASSPYIETWVDNNQLGTSTIFSTLGGIRAGGYWEGAAVEIWVDNVIVRQYTSPEPIAGVGADIEFQTRTSSDGSSWEAWKPTTNETQIDSMDSPESDWVSTGESRSIVLEDTIAHNSAITEYSAVDTLDSNHFVVAYQDDGGLDYGCAKVGVISGSTVTFGAENCFNNALSEEISVAALDSTHFVVTYFDDGGADYACARVGVVSGTTISSYGTENCFRQYVGTYGYTDVTDLDSTLFVASYVGSLENCSKVGTVSGTTISYGSEECTTSYGMYLSNATLNSSKFVMNFRNGTNAKGTSVVGTVSGTSISFGSEYTFHDASTQNPYSDSLDSSHFVVVYRDWDDSEKGTAVVGTVSGTSISYTNEYVFESEVGGWNGVAGLGPNRFVVSYTDTTEAYMKVGIVFGSTILFGEKYTFSTSSTSDISVAAFDSSVFVISYSTSQGYSRVGRAIPSFLNENDESTIKMEGDGSLIATVGAQLVDANTRGLWHLEETNGDLAGDDVFDETSYDNDGEFNGSGIATAVVDGVYGKARDFNGSNDYIEITDADSLDFGTSDSFTIEAWIKSQGSGSYQNIVRKDNVNMGGTRTYYILRIQNTNVLAGYIHDGNYSRSVIGTTVIANDNQWHHVALMRDVATDSVTIYLDGEKEGTASDPTTATLANPAQVNIGCHANTSTSATEFFNGLIDEVKISNIARSAEEITETYRRGRDHRLNRTISSTDLSGKTKVPFYFAADKQGTIAETYVGETDHAVYGSDSNTKGLWHLDGTGQNNENIRFDSTNLGAANAYTYWKTLDDATVVATNDTFEYDVYLENNLGAIGGIDIRFTDTTYARGSGWTDQNSISCHPAQDIKSYAYGKWFHRVCTVPASLNGKTVDWIDVVNEVDTTTAITAYYDNFVIKNSSGAIKSTIYTSGAPDYNVYDLRSSASNTGNAALNRSQTGARNESGNSLESISFGGASLAQGKIGGARYFDGSDDYIEIGNTSSLDAGGKSNWSVSLWFKPQTTGSGNNNNVLVSKWSGTDGYQYNLGYLNDDSDTMVFAVRTGGTGTGGSTQSVQSNTKVNNTSKWYHIAGTYDGTNVKIFIDGAEDNSNSGSGSMNTSVSSAVTIGCYSDLSNNINGIIDEVRISDTNRTADEIRLAYQYGLRTHQINVDFKASLDSGNLITGSGDTSFTVDATAYGLEDKGDALYVHDKVIVKENYNGTNYIAQGDVTAVTASTGAVTVDAWDTGSTFPGSGYTANATVFKWQREYWDLGDISPNDRNATTKLGLRILDANEGFTMYLDDIRSNTNYLTDNLGATVSSTANRYLQYRAFLSTNNTAVTPELTSVTLDYNLAPTAPTSLLAEGSTNPTGVTDLSPEFSAIYNDPDAGDVANKYRIQVDDDAGFGSTLWDSGASGTAMTNCAEGARCEDISYGGASSDLQWSTKYYWRIKYFDEGAGEGDWSTEEAHFTMDDFIAPTGCHMDDGSQPGQITVKWQDNDNKETGFRIERSVDGGAYSLLTTEGVDSTSSVDNTTSADHTYQYRIRGNSDNGNTTWCGTTEADFSEGGFKFEGVSLEGLKID